MFTTFHRKLCVNTINLIHLATLDQIGPFNSSNSRGALTEYHFLHVYDQTHAFIMYVNHPCLQFLYGHTLYRAGLFFPVWKKARCFCWRNMLWTIPPMKFLSVRSQNCCFMLCEWKSLRQRETFKKSLAETKVHWRVNVYNKTYVLKSFAVA